MKKKTVVLAFALLLLLSTCLHGFVIPSSLGDSASVKRPYELISATLEGAQPETVDPAWAYDTASGELISNVYDTLLTFDGEHTDTFIPHVANGLPTITPISETSPEGLPWDYRYTFQIRQGIKFQNGVVLTPQDVEYSIERELVMDRDGGPQWMLYEPLLNGEGATYINGKDYDLSRTADAVTVGKMIDHAVGSNATHAWFNLAFPGAYAPFLQILCLPWASIMSKNWVVNTVISKEGRHDWNGDWSSYTSWVAFHNPDVSPLDQPTPLAMGSGPFMLETLDYSARQWSATRFVDYWGGWPASASSGSAKAAGSASAGYVDHVVETWAYNWETRKEMFLAGDVDFCAVPRQYYDEMLNQPGIRCIFPLPTLECDALFFQFNIDPTTPFGPIFPAGTFGETGIPSDFFGNAAWGVHTRKAFAFAIDYTGLIAQAFQGEAVHPATAIIQGITGYDPTVKGYAYNLTAAMEEFKKVPGLWNTGFTITLGYNTGNILRRLCAELLKAALEALNPKFHVNVVVLELSLYLNAMIDMWLPAFITGYLASYPDAHEFAFAFYGSTGVFAGWQSYFNAEMDALIQQGIREGDLAKRMQIYRDIQALAVADCPSAIIAQLTGRLWLRDWVIGYIYNSARMGIYVYILYKVPAVRSPVAAFTESTHTPMVGERVTFTPDGCKPGLDGMYVCFIEEYRWNFGDGSPVETMTSAVEVSHEYAAPGLYTVRLTVWAPIVGPANPDYVDTGFAEATKNVTSGVRSPVAAFTESTHTPMVGQVVTFTPDGCLPGLDGMYVCFIEEYRWSFGDGKTETKTAADAVQHAYAAPGLYTVRLTVWAPITGPANPNYVDTGFAEAIKNVTGAPPPATRSPVAKFSETTETPLVGQVVTFTPDGCLPGLDGMYVCPIQKYTWDFGDGTAQIVQANPVAVQHSYALPGRYTVRLTVWAPRVGPENPNYHDTNFAEAIKNVISPPPQDWWPMFHHDPKHIGYSTSTAPNTNRTLWNYTTGSYGVFSSPAVADDKVFVGSMGNKTYALNANTGNLIWSYATGGPVSSSPAVADGKVFIGSNDLRVYALDENTGSLIWNYTTGGWVESSPAVADGKVFVGSGNKVYALNETTGSLIWSYTTGSEVESSPAVADGKVFVGSYNGKVYALNETTGSLIWSYTTEGSASSSPAVADGKVFIGSNDLRVYALDENTGSLIWNYTTGGWVESSPAVADGKVFVGSGNKVYALGENTGGLIWSYTNYTFGLVMSSPAVADGKVFIGWGDYKVYALDENTGSLIWSYTTGGPVYSSPAVADGKVFVGSNDGKVYAFTSGAPTDLNDDGIVNILDVSIVAKPYGSKRGDTNWNEIADLDGNGVINILDIALVAKDFGKHG